MKCLTFIGGDTGFGINNTSAYSIINNNLLLIDCGSTVFSKLLVMEKNRKFLSKRNSIEVIITHLHDDHVGSLSQLISYCYFYLNKQVKIYSNCSKLQTRLDVSNTPKEGYIIMDNPNINFIKTNHCIDMDSYGFQTTINNQNIIYTGDTNTLEPFYNYINYGTELYVDTNFNKNSTHLNLTYIFDVLNRLSLNGVDIYLMHLDKEKLISDYIKETNIHLYKDNKLNKQDIINILTNYQFNPNEYQVISGAAMVLYDYKDFTNDIDIAVSQDYYEYLLKNYDCSFEKLNSSNEPIFFIDNIINFGHTYYNNHKNFINNIPVQTKEDLIKLKKDLNRPKDIKELKLIK